MIIYLAGPMTGLPDLNYPAFNETASELRRLGHTVLNPADNVICADTPKDKIWLAFMRLSLPQVAQCEIIYKLAGWENSKGASIEVQLAIDIGIPTRNYYPPRKTA